MLTTLAQMQAMLRRVAAFLDTKADKADLLAREELEIICATRPLEIAAGCSGVMNKFGLLLKTPADCYSEMGNNWSVEFFVKLNNPLTNHPEAPAMHFAILDIDSNGLALGLTKESMVDGHPSEGFFFGDINNPHDGACFDLSVTIADGQRHHVLIEHYPRGDSTTNAAVYVDGTLIVANNFGSTTISNFTRFVFGADAFLEPRCLENLATFDRIRLLGECRYLPAGSDIPDTITVPTEPFSFTEPTLMLYQDGLLNVFMEDGESLTTGES